MNIPFLHPWKVSPAEAREIQEKLRKRLRLRPPRTPLKTIAAGDVAYSREDDMTYAAFLLFTYPGLTLLESASAKGRASFPYIPGFLTFREAPILLKAFSRLKTRPDLILNLPAIGCAKSRLIGTHEELAPDRGKAVPLLVGDRTAGTVLRTRAGVKPVYVSPGHKMNMETSVKIVLSLCRGYRIPEPLRQAHMFVSKLRG